MHAVPDLGLRERSLSDLRPRFTGRQFWPASSVRSRVALGPSHRCTCPRFLPCARPPNRPKWVKFPCGSGILKNDIAPRTMTISAAMQYVRKEINQAERFAADGGDHRHRNASLRWRIRSHVRREGCHALTAAPP